MASVYILNVYGMMAEIKIEKIIILHELFADLIGWKVCWEQ